jgi:succinate dehydrogenase / fumarate reductase cytochrome b subunit
MKLVANIFGSSLGKKYVMAISGVVLFLFVIGHLVGNLQIFLGPEAINRYGHFLQSNLELIWPVRFILLGMIGLHIWAAIKLSRENKAARPIAYSELKPAGASYASRTMLMSGLIVFAFIVYHLLHFTVQVQYVNRTGQDFTTFVDVIDPAKPRHDIFQMMVVGFSSWMVSGFYLLGIGLLCLHLSHGASSMFQSLGVKNKSYGPILDKSARAIALLIFIGYLSIPAAILAGFGRDYVSKKVTTPVVVPGGAH